MSEQRIGERIRELRLEKGWSLRELARRSGMTTTGVGNVEKGATTPSSATVAKLSRALFVDPGVLYSSTPLKPPSSMAEALQRVGVNDDALAATDEEFAARMEGLSVDGLLTFHACVKSAMLKVDSFAETWLEREDLEPAEELALKRIRARARERSMLAFLKALAALEDAKARAEERGDEDAKAEIIEKELALSGAGR